ncbi:MAG TPA: protein kinase [Trebonia sp.]|nr:protein kinase [Trebonia sp.]
MEAGTVLADRYKLAERLGRGAMGEVWRAQDSRLYDRDVAVKMLLVRDPDPGELERFAREAGVAARLAHPGITVVHDIGQHDDQVFIVMELLRGENLDALLLKHPQGLPVSQVVGFAVQVASALATAHAAGVVHRDLKPANLFVQGDHVKICDFGLARDDAFRTITMAGEVIGTPAYMAPEQWNGEPATTSSDLYALGGIISQMLTGELAFPGPSMAALLNQHLNVAPTPPASRVPQVPPALNDLVLSLLAKDPAERPRSTTWVLEALTRIRDSGRDWPDPGPPPAKPAKPAARPAKPGRRAPEAKATAADPEPTPTDATTIAATAAKPATAKATSAAVPSFRPHPPQAAGASPVAAIACAPLGPELRVFALTAKGRIRHCSRSEAAGGAAKVTTAGAPGDGALQDGAAQHGAARDGAARDGAAQHSAARDGAAQHSAARDGARDGAARNGASPAGTAPCDGPVKGGSGWTSWSDVLSPTGQQPVVAIAATSAHATYYSLLADNSALAAVADDGLYISRSGSAWRSMDGPGGQPLSAHIVDIAVASWTRASLSSQPGEPRKPPSPVNVFALDADGKIWKNSRSGWKGVPVSRPVNAIAACSFRNEDQLLLCVADGAVSVASYEAQSGAASSLPAWPHAATVRVVDIACLSLAADSQEAFALDADGNIWHTRSSPPAPGPGRPATVAPWAAWTRIEGTPANVTAIAAGSQSGGDRSWGALLLSTADGTIHQSSADLDATEPSAWANWSQLPALVADEAL